VPTGETRIVSYERLWTELQLLGAILRDFGVGKGDRVLIAMPDIPEAAFGMLACARIGAVHAAMPGDAPAADLAACIDAVKPVLILSASCQIGAGGAVDIKRSLDEALSRARHPPQACIVLQRPQAAAEMTAGRDRDWRSLWEEAVNYAKTSDCVPLPATHPLCIAPDGGLSDHGGAMVAAAISTERDAHRDEAGLTAGLATAAGQGALYAALVRGQTAHLCEGGPRSTNIGSIWAMPPTIADPPIASAI
jgi:propionyl-CoA synthetase